MTDRERKETGKKTQKKIRNRCWGQCHQQHTVLALQTTVRLIFLFRGWCEFLFLLSFFEKHILSKTYFANKAKNLHFVNEALLTKCGVYPYWQNVLLVKYVFNYKSLVFHFIIPVLVLFGICHHFIINFHHFLFYLNPNFNNLLHFSQFTTQNFNSEVFPLWLNFLMLVLIVLLLSVASLVKFLYLTNNSLIF